MKKRYKIKAQATIPNRKNFNAKTRLAPKETIQTPKAYPLPTPKHAYKGNNNMKVFPAHPPL
jgi:hypothetical protein